MSYLGLMETKYTFITSDLLLHRKFTLNSVNHGSVAETNVHWESG